MSTNREFLHSYSEGIPCDPSSHSHRGNLEVIRCDRWFKMHVNSWIKMANQRCMERIEKAIKIDEVRRHWWGLTCHSMGLHDSQYCIQ